MDASSCMKNRADSRGCLTMQCGLNFCGALRTSSQPFYRRRRDTRHQQEQTKRTYMRMGRKVMIGARDHHVVARAASDNLATLQQGRLGSSCAARALPRSSDSVGGCTLVHNKGNTRRRRSTGSSSFGKSSSRSVYKTRSSGGGGEEEQQVENITGTDTYCDDFVCTSSPAVETTVRALAKDIERGNGVWTRSLLSKDVEYVDSFRRSKGIEAFSLDFVPKIMTPTSIRVTRMRMLDQPPGRARISWRLEGHVGRPGIPVDVDMTTDIDMNLLTGQIEKRVDSWSLPRCSPISKLAWLAWRAWWSVQGAAKDATKATSSVLDSLTSMDEGDEGDIYTQADPRDPMKFFQQRDSFKDDATSLIAFLLVVYIIVQGYTILFSSSSSSSSGF